MNLLHEARILFVLGIGLVFANLAQAASAPDVAVYRGADRQARLEKGAKAEGEFVWYTSVNAEDIQRIVELFGKRYPLYKPNRSGLLQPGSSSATLPNPRPALF